MGRKILKKPEVLAPAGTLEKLKTAILYGADAVFLGGEAYGLRSRAGNFDFAEMKEAVDFAHAHNAKVSMYEYARPSWTGLTYPIECYFPTWVIPKDHKVTEALEEAYTSLYGNERIGAEDTVEMRKARPLTDKWTFSTNGVSIMGRNGIPCIGFGPGAEAQAHAPNEITWKQDLVTCAAVYALLPSVYCKD